jgi:hypothetical protein
MNLAFGLTVLAIDFGLTETGKSFQKYGTKIKVFVKFGIQLKACFILVLETIHFFQD